MGEVKLFYLKFRGVTDFIGNFTYQNKEKNLKLGEESPTDKLP